MQESSASVGTVVKKMGKRKCLVKTQPDGKYIVNVEEGADYDNLKAGTRVALRSDSNDIMRILPTSVDRLYL